MDGKQQHGDTMPEAATEKRVAIVTGASRGIGNAIAQRLADDGHHVVLVSRSEEALKNASAAINNAGGSTSYRTCDVTDSKAWGDCVTAIAKEFGRLDILVNNAGILRDNLIMRMSDEDFDAIIDVHLKSVFVSARAAIRPMMGKRFGRIVTVGSVTGVIGRPGQANYAAAKAGAIGLSKSIAREYATKGITANVVAPGFIETDMTADLPDKLKQEAAALTPMKRFGTPTEVAAAVSFLASEEAAYITGHVICVDGGMAM